MMKLFVTKVNDWKLIIFVKKSSPLDFVLGLDTSVIISKLQDFLLLIINFNNNNLFNYF